MEPGAKEKKNEETLMRILFVTLVFSVMNATLFYVVLPQISEEFALAASSLSWLVAGYMIVYAFGSAIFGKLADKYRLKDLLTFGILFMALGSMLGDCHCISGLCNQFGNPVCRSAFSGKSK